MAEVKTVKKWIDYYGCIRLCDVRPDGTFSCHSIGCGTCKVETDPPTIVELTPENGYYDAPEDAAEYIRKRCLKQVQEYERIRWWLQGLLYKNAPTPEMKKWINKEVESMKEIEKNLFERAAKAKDIPIARSDAAWEQENSDPIIQKKRSRKKKKR